MYGFSQAIKVQTHSKIIVKSLYVDIPQKHQ